ncbi:MAG: DUF2851 family protein [Opitutaceae bacterium]
MPLPAPEWNVAEIQGLYGPFTFPERLLQKIWLQGEFDSARAATEDGRPLQVLHPGRWNLLGGPDFRDARFCLGGQELTGDVELHLHAGDWAAHAHPSDRHYDHVVLHVVLFPPSSGEQALRADGTAIPTLVLLPLLLHDLEEYAAEDAVETLASRTDWRVTAKLACRPAAEMRALLQARAVERWRQKRYFARRRLERLGWGEACHYAALEILGYRFNRAPMLKVAARVPLAAWAGGTVAVDALLAAETGAWSRQGLRPANHPRVRLEQYAAWTHAQPSWPECLLKLAAALGPLPPEGRAWPTALVRRRLNLPALRDRFAREIVAGAVSGTRLDNLICDGFLPLLTARTMVDHFPIWFHWFPGDLPPHLTGGLMALGIFDGSPQPACHGWAQGLLGWMLTQEAESDAGFRKAPATTTGTQ